MNDCNISVFQSVKTHIFSVMKMDVNIYGTVSFKNQICPYVFINSQIERLTIGKMVDHFLKKNVLKFKYDNMLIDSNFKSSIEELDTDVYDLSIKIKLIRMYSNKLCF